MTTLNAISAKLELIDGKKSTLKKAFEDLQLQSQSQSHPTLSNLNWEELDSYFSSLQSDLLHKFSLLQPQQPKPEPDSKPTEPKLPAPDPVPARPELKSFCEKMDGIGLRNYVIDHPKERVAIRVELADAFRHAPDPGVLVLDAVRGFWPDGFGYVDLGGVRRACVVLLEEFNRVKLEIGEVAREKAKELAIEWKGKIGTEVSVASRVGGSRRRGGGAFGEELDEALDKLCLLYLIAAFRLETNVVLEKSELVEYAVAVGDHRRPRQVVELCHSLDFGDEIYDVVQTLINMGKQLLAIKFIFQFEITNKFPPVPLLKSYLSDSKKLAQKVRKKGKGSRQSLNEALAKEISSLRSVIKIIDEHNLEDEYPKDDLLKSIENLEKEKSNRKRVASQASNAEHPHKQQKQGGSGITRRNGAVGASGVHNIHLTSAKPMQQSYVQTAGLLPDPYLRSSAAAYGLAGSPAVASYAGASAAMYGSGVPAGYSGNLDPSLANAYPSESQTPTYYDRSLTYGAYGAQPEYHLSYYPQ